MEMFVHISHSLADIINAPFHSKLVLKIVGLPTPDLKKGMTC
jgi:hypothetical protein